MARDSALFVRQAAIETLRAAAGAPLPDGSIYAEETPADVARPFVKSGEATSAGFQASCMDGSAVRFVLHGMTGPSDTPGANQAHALVAWIASVLDGATLSLQGPLSDCPYPATAHIEWTRNQVIADSTSGPGAFHGIAQFTAQVVS